MAAPSSTRAAPRAASAWPSEALAIDADREPAPDHPAPPVAARATFPGAARLRSPAEFGPALKGRRLAKGALFVLSAAHAPARDARLGLVIGKRFAPHSVSRNALKRVLREAFRVRRAELPGGDYVVRLHARIPVLSLTGLKRAARQEIDGHLARALRWRPPG